MKYLRILFLMSLPFLMSGCVVFESVIFIKPDGSGTITQTSMMSRKAVEQMASMANAFGAKGDATGSFDKAVTEMFSAKQARQQMAKMGDGVTFVSYAPATTAEATGMKAVYSFKDISKLKLDMKPGGNLGETGLQGSEAEKSLPTFHFQRLENGHSLLTLPLGSLDTAADLKSKKVITNDDLANMPEKGGGTPDPAAMEMFRQMLGGMKIRMAIEIEGKLVETNCPFVEKNQITLLNIDFDEVLKTFNDPAKLQGMLRKKPGSLAEAQALMKELKGIQAPLVPEIRIEFAAH